MASQSFSIRLADEEREALERAAQADDRPVSALARKIIMEWLRKQPKAPKR
jgi:predicted transcriptional regulator